MKYAIDELFGKALDEAVPETWTVLNLEQLSRLKTKFAELIVKEMLAITDAHTEVFQTDRDKALIEHIKQSVKQHFGVEE
jgi:hypothetical protein